jgi:DNA polymerase-1
MGDSVDNVPGIPGVGPKTASALIKHFGSLAQMIERADEIASIPGLRGAASVRDKVKANAEQAKLSRELVALDVDVPVPVELEGLKRLEPDMARVEALLHEYEFSRLIDRLKPLRAAHAQETAQAAVVEAAAVAVTATPSDIGQRTPTLVTEAAQLDALIASLEKAEMLALAMETSGGPAISTAIIGIGFAAEGTTAYLPLGHRYLGVPHQLAVDDALSKLKPLLESETVRKHVFESKDAEILLARHGIRLRGIDSDPRVASYVLDPTQDHELKPLCARLAGVSIEDREALCGKGKKATPYESLELERAAKFAGCEAEATLALGAALTAQIRAKPEVRQLFDEIEMPLSHVLAVIERHGVCLDVHMLRTLSGEVETKLHAIEDEVRKITGSDVNLGSPKQLQDLLFDKLGLSPLKKTKTGFSVDAEVLEELAPLHPVAAQILEHRTLAKLKGTYLDALPLLVDAHSGRLHTSYKQTIAATGRLSSVEPNLQNVPIRTEQGKEIRRAFRADKGCQLVVADYSQIELRVLAHLSKDPVLIDAFRRDQDIHRRTVEEMFGADKADDPQLRSVAKMINYGIVYGLSDFGLAQRLGIERADAKRYIDGYLKLYAVLDRYMHKIIEDAYKEGGSRTLLGRWRPIPELAAKNRMLRNAGERMARNTPVQGTAADLLKVAMIRVQQFLDAEAPDAKMLLTVHDELVLEAPEAKASAVGEKLKDVMEHVWPLDVPLKVDLGIGSNWAEAK